MAKSNPTPVKKPEPKKPEPKKEMEVSTAPGWMWFILVLATALIIIGIAVATHEPASKNQKQAATTEKWVHGWTDETNGRMKTMPTTVVVRKGIINFSYVYGNNKKGRGAGTLQADGAYVGTWSDNCGSGTFYLKQEGNANHYTGWQTGNKYPGKKFPMFLTKIMK